MPRARSTRRIAAASARQNLSRLLMDVRREEEPVIIEKGGVPVAAVVPLSMLDRDRRWAEERAGRLALLERLRRPFRDLPSGEIERETSEAVAAARRDRRRRQATRR
jgi:prevent-host-death family protein